MFDAIINQFIDIQRQVATWHKWQNKRNKKYKLKSKSTGQALKNVWTV